MERAIKQNNNPTLWDGEIADDFSQYLPDNIEPLELDIPDMGVEVELLEFYTPEFL